MSSSDPHDEHKVHAPPGLPEIQDEAADTPSWLPLLGLALFIIGAIFLAINVSTPSDAAPVPTSGAPIVLD